MGESKAEKNDEATEKAIKDLPERDPADEVSDRDQTVLDANEAAIEEGKAAVEAYNAEAEAADADQKADAEA